MAYFTRGHALVIGVGKYRDPDWDASITVADAQGVVDALIDPAVSAYPKNQVEFLHDQRATLDGVITELKQLGGRVKPTDTVVLFFCGHGLLGTDGLYYFTTQDTVFTVDARVQAGTGLEGSQLVDLLRTIKAKKLLLIINACFSGHLSPSLGPRTQHGVSPDASLGIEVLGTGEGRAFITSSRPDQRAFYHEEQKHTYFGQALIDALHGRQGIANSDGYIGLYELYQHIYTSVTKVTDGKQEPVLTILQGVGPFPLAHYPGTIPGSLGETALKQTPPRNMAVEEIGREELVQAVGIGRQRFNIVGSDGVSIDQHKQFDFTGAHISGGISLNISNNAPTVPPLIQTQDILLQTARVQPVPLSSLYAFQVNAGHKEKWPPCDVGMIWGINRGSFIGAILDEENLDLYAYLVTVEHTLSDALPTQEKNRFPGRWWIQVDMENDRNGPNSLSEVWAAANNQESVRVANLYERNLLPNAIPGIVIETGLTTFSNENFLEMSRAWCSALLRIFSHKQLAIVFIINAQQSTRAHHRLALLAENLQSIPEVRADRIPVEIMTLEPFTRNSGASSDADISSTGTCFSNWVRHIIRTEDYRRQGRNPTHDFTFVLSTFEGINKQGYLQENKGICSAEDVVEDIGTIHSPTFSMESQHLLDSQFLHMVKLYLPGYMYDLVKAYAQSFREKARLTALSTAFDSDMLLDAWVSGTFNSENQEGDLSLLKLISNNVFNWESSEALVLALMRNYGSMLPTTRNFVQEFIENCLAKLGRAESLEAIWRLCCRMVEGATDQVDDLYASFFQEEGFSEERIRLAIRAKLHLNEQLPLAALLPFLDLDHPDVWWLIMALPPSRERLHQLLMLCLGKSQRAVAGICTPAEWQQLAHDQVLQDKLLACRYGRALCFRS